MVENKSNGGCEMHGPVEVCGHTDATCPDLVNKLEVPDFVSGGETSESLSNTNIGDQEIERARIEMEDIENKKREIIRRAVLDKYKEEVKELSDKLEQTPNQKNFLWTQVFQQDFLKKLQDELTKLTGEKQLLPFQTTDVINRFNYTVDTLAGDPILEQQRIVAQSINERSSPKEVSEAEKLLKITAYKGLCLFITTLREDTPKYHYVAEVLDQMDSIVQTKNPHFEPDKSGFQAIYDIAKKVMAAIKVDFEKISSLYYTAEGTPQYQDSEKLLVGLSNVQADYLFDRGTLNITLPEEKQ